MQAEALVLEPAYGTTLNIWRRLEDNININVQEVKCQTWAGLIWLRKGTSDGLW